MGANCLFTTVVSLATIAACMPGDLKLKKNGKENIAVIPLDENKSSKFPPVFINNSALSYEELEYIFSRQQGIGNVQRPKTLTPCARAILGCCKGGIMEEECSVDVGCGAYFFDANPCTKTFVRDALAAARAYYGQFLGISKVVK